MPPPTETVYSLDTYSNQEAIDIAKYLHQKYKPIWLSSEQGWNGGSHSDAIQFCSAIHGKQLCPYSAMCPHGEGHAVMGGRHSLEFDVEGEQYAPVLDDEEHWVMIGSVHDEQDSNKCRTHRETKGKAPDWGSSGGGKEMKLYIMCCSII